MDPAVLRAGTAQTDSVVSLAFTPNYGSAEGLAAAIAEEGTAMAVLGDALIGSDRSTKATRCATSPL